MCPIDQSVTPAARRYTRGGRMSAQESTTEKTVSTFGSVERETKNQVRYSTGWGVVYIPKAQLEKIGNPENIKITVSVQEG